MTTAPVTARDRLASLYRSPGPYVSVYLATHVEHDSAGGGDIQDRWQPLRADMAGLDAPTKALAAIDARLQNPAPDDIAAIAVIAASDGTTIVDHGAEPPRADVARLDTLPVAAPLLEWQQRRVPHLIVVTDELGADIVTFGADHASSIATYDQSLDALVVTIVDHARAINAEIVIVSAAGPSEDLVNKLRVALPSDCRLIDDDDSSGPTELADAAIRHVTDHVARRVVGRLRELRFLATHDDAVHGTDDTIAALADGSAARLLLHDDPRDERRVWIGNEPQQLANSEQPELDVTARLTDAAIRSAILQGIPITIIPTTGPEGPDENTAAILQLGDELDIEG